MSTVTFDIDTLKFVKTLEASGINAEQAEAIAVAYRDSSADQELATTKDMQIELAPIKADIQILKWMIGLMLAACLASPIKKTKKSTNYSCDMV